MQKEISGRSDAPVKRTGLNRQEQLIQPMDGNIGLDSGQR
jgi:hypothetical protein